MLIRLHFLLGMDEMVKILIFGGLGYVGTVAHAHLNKCGHKIYISDSNWFEYSGPNIGSQNTFKDIRQISGKDYFDDVDTVVYPIMLSNDPMGTRFENKQTK